MTRVRMLSFRRSLGSVLDRVSLRDELVELVRGGRGRRDHVVAVLISPARLERLERAASAANDERQVDLEKHLAAKKAASS
jgi:hypothetical protein